MNRYQQQLRTVLSPAEHKIISKFNTPQKIQDFLDSFPINELGEKGHTMRSPRKVLKMKKAHCMEGALLAAASLAYHGREPLLLDLQTGPKDQDHVVSLFKENGLWGAISKTNHPVLRYRDPVYRSVRELAMSYFHEYAIWWNDPAHGQKTLRAYSKPFNLNRYAPKRWVVAQTNLDWLAEALDASSHSPVAPASILKKLRKANEIELQAMKLREWRQGRRNKY